MISITHLFGKDNRVLAGTQVSLIHNGISNIGRVVACNYSENNYIIQFIDRCINTHVVERRRHQINPVEDIEFEEVVEDCRQLGAVYEPEDFVHLEMM